LYMYAATLLGDFVKELTTKVVAAHVLLEKTPEEIGDDRVKIVSDSRDDLDSLRKAALQHLGASRSKINKTKEVALCGMSISFCPCDQQVVHDAYRDPGFNLEWILEAAGKQAFGADNTWPI